MIDKKNIMERVKYTIDGMSVEELLVILSDHKGINATVCQSTFDPMEINWVRKETDKEQALRVGLIAENAALREDQKEKRYNMWIQLQKEFGG